MFKTIIKSNSKDAEVLEFSPGTIQHQLPDGAQSFVRDQGIPRNDFIMNELIAVTTGVKEREHSNYMRDLEKGILEKLKEVQEPAYKEAYALGLKDGQEKAYADNNATISEFLGQLTRILQEIKNQKDDLGKLNEAHIVKLIYHIASMIALKEIVQSQDTIRAVVARSLQNAQSDEEIKVHLNPKDLEFLRSLKGKHGDPLEKLPKVSMEPNDNISSGGCLIETNYGAIDATVETRLKEVWKTLEQTVPQPTEEKA